jgi:hypothetical protein
MSAASRTLITFMTGKPNFVLMAATRSGVSLPMELQQVERGCGEDCGDPRIVVIDEETGLKTCAGIARPSAPACSGST